jgi:kynureninase
VTPLYTTFRDVWECLNRIEQVVTEKRNEHYSDNRLSVT